MLKLEIEVKEVASKERTAKRCGMQSSIAGCATPCEAIAMASAMGKAFGALQQATPDLSDALYDYFADALKKELGVDDK